MIALVLQFGAIQLHMAQSVSSLKQHITYALVGTGTLYIRIIILHNYRNIDNVECVSSSEVSLLK